MRHLKAMFLVFAAVLTAAAAAAQTDTTAVCGTEAQPDTVACIDTAYADTATVASQAQYVMSYAEWLAGEWHDLGEVSVGTRSKYRILWGGGGDIRLTTGNSVRDDKLKKFAFVLRTDSALYVSLRKLKARKAQFGNNFTRAWMLPDSTLLFTYFPIGKADQMKVATAGAMFGIAGGLIAAGKQLSRPKILYAITDGSRDVQRLGHDGLHDLLAKWPEVQRQVDLVADGSDAYDTPRVLQCMREGGILSDR